MKKSTLRCITLMLLAILCTATQTLYAQTFSMASEASSQNTPSGWTTVDLPTGLPEITTANTFDITTYGASTSSSDNTTAIQAALDEAESAGGGMVVIPAGEWMFGRIQVGAKTIFAPLCWSHAETVGLQRPARPYYKDSLYYQQEQCHRHCHRR